MWYIYLIGSLIMFGMAIWNIVMPERSDGAVFFIGVVVGIWLLNSARVAYREDQKSSRSGGE